MFTYGLESPVCRKVEQKYLSELLGVIVDAVPNKEVVVVTSNTKGFQFLALFSSGVETNPPKSWLVNIAMLGQFLQ